MQVTRIVAPDEVGLREAVSALRAGLPVGLPTETVYGLAAPLDDLEALARIFEAKGRPHTDPLIVHFTPDLWAHGQAVDALDGLAALGVVSLAALDGRALAAARGLAAALWPGPLTLVLPRGPRVASLVTSGLETVAVRFPRHAVARALIAALGSPLCAPSANRFGRVSPTTAAAVFEELGGRIALIVDGGACEVGLESTVVRVEPSTGGSPRLTVLRPGGLTLEALGEAAGAGVFISLATAASSSLEAGAAAPSPGLLESHYAPSAPLWRLPSPVASRDRALLADDVAGLASGERVGLLLCCGDSARAAAALFEATGRTAVTAVLSPAGDEAEAGRRFFAVLRELDEAGVGRLLAEPPPSTGGLWCAIDDRLRRAAVRRP